MRRLLIIPMIITLAFGWGKWGKWSKWTGWTGKKQQLQMRWNMTGDPVGGGYTYSNILPVPSGNGTTSFVVDTYNELTTAVGSATDGDTIWVEDGAEIQLTDKITLNNQEVILASGRGRIINDTVSWGGLLYRDQGIEDREELIYIVNLATGDTVRITGLRLRNGNSFQSNHATTDSVDTYITPANDCILMQSYGVIEVDNCEIRGGFGKQVSIMYADAYIHHNYFWDNSQYYQGYAVCFYKDSASIISRGNIWDGSEYGIMIGGGDDCEATHGLQEYDVFGEYNMRGYSYHHGDGDSCCVDTARDIIIFTSYDEQIVGSCVSNGEQPNRDSSLFTNITVDCDSADCWAATNNFKLKRPNNWYQGYLTSPYFTEIRPLAVIASDYDSITEDNEVTFSSSGSYDPDGQIYYYYWDFGDSAKYANNYARYTLRNKQDVQHTYNNPGLYTVTLTVVDNEGVHGRTWKDILVKPASGSAKICSFWWNDRSPFNDAGYWAMRMKVNGTVAWTHDIAGGNTWALVNEDITTEVSTNDSVTIRFELYCTRDTASGMMGPWGCVDNAHVFGGKVINGAFDSLTWTGNIYGQTDGYWVGGMGGASGHYMQSWLWTGPRNTGSHVYGWCGEYLSDCDVGDNGYVEQKIDILGQ